MSKEPQKYFEGNFVRHKTEGWTGVIYAVAIDDWDGVQTILYSIAFFGDPEEEVGEEHYGLFWEPEIPELFDIIPYPWQEFFKVGDKVKEPGAEKIGTVDHIASKEEIESGFRPIYVIYPGHSRHYFYNPHELIKIGE